MTREIYAWLADDLDGVEGIIMIPSPAHRDGVLPMVACDPKHIANARTRPFIIMAARERRATARLIRYVEAEVIAEVEPQ